MKPNRFSTRKRAGREEGINGFSMASSGSARIMLPAGRLKGEKEEMLERDGAGDEHGNGL